MAKKPATAADAPERPADFPPLPAFEDEATYSVRLYRTITHGGRKLTPATLHNIKGKVAKEYPADIYTAALVPQEEVMAGEVTARGQPQA